MSEYQRYMDAARNAHAQGDQEAARRLVQKAKALGGDVVAEVDGGRVTRSPDGSLKFASPNYSTNDQETIARLMQGAGVKEVVQSTTDRIALDQNEALARSGELLRGLPFVGSYADEARGAARGDKARDNARYLSEAMQRERPGETMALNLGGAVAGSIPLAAASAPAIGALAPTSTAARMAAGGMAGLLGGATEGAVYGYGEGTDPESRRRQAATQAGIGAAAGGVLGLVGPVAGDFIGTLIERYKNTDVDQIAKKFKVSKDTAKVLKKAFSENDATAVDRILRAGDEATLADAGRSGMALLDAAAATGGKPLQVVDSAVGARASRAAGIVDDALDSALGPVTGPRAAAREVAEATRPQRTAAYTAAYGTPIDYSSAAGRKVEEVLSRVPPKTMARAVAEANEEMASKGQRNLQILFDADTGQFFEMPNVQQLDEIKKALDGIARENVDNFGRPTQTGVRNSRLASEVRDATVQATGGDNGPYAQALAIGRGKIEMDQGLQMGLDMLRGTRMTREEVLENLAGMSQDGRAMVRRGLRSYIDEALSNVKMIASDPDAMQSREAMQALRLLTSTNSKDKLRALLGPAEFDRLWPQIEKAISSQEMVAAVATNSKTAVRQSLQGEVNEVTAPGVLGTLARGKPVDTTQALTQALLDTTPGADAARKEQIWTEIAQVLSERRGNKSAMAALKYIEDAINGQPLTEAQARLIANQVVATGVLSGGRSANQLLATP